MNRIKELRQSKGLTQAELAQKVGISEQAVSFYENDRRKPKMETWNKLADFFNVSVPFLQGMPEPAGKNRLKELRQKKNLTLKKLGKHVGMLDSTLSQYENGKREPGQEVWQKLAYYFGTSVSYIRGDLDTEYLEKIVELLMLINFPNVCLKYRNNELNDSCKPFLTISITSQIIQLLGHDSRKKFQEIYAKAMRLGDNPENSIEVKAYKEQFFKILTTSKEITNHLLKEYEKLEEKQNERQKNNI